MIELKNLYIRLGSKIMRIVNIINHELVISDVGDDWIRCSVSGEYRPKEEYYEDGKMVRTNCIRTYKLSGREYDLEKEISTKLLKSNAANSKRIKINQDYTNHNEGIAVNDLIKILTDFAEKNPKARIVATQEGYYCDGQFADIHTPEPLETYPNLYSISHSAQNY